MSALKDHDPDYGPSVANNEKHQRIYEENARSNTAKKITAIIEKEFSQEINTKEKEVLEIQDRLHRASKALHFLRYVIVADFYNRKQCQSSQNGEAKQTQIHPAIKELIGKSPKECDGLLISTSATASSSANDFVGAYSYSTCSSNTVVDSALNLKRSKNEDVCEDDRSRKIKDETDEQSRPKKIPRYIPPKSGIPEPPCPSRGIRHKTRKRIIIGNISKWIPPEWREDAASHKWTMYVRGNKENPDIDNFVGKVRFFLHPSYRPNDVVEVTAPPFCLSRRGWGEFPLRVQLHFKSALNKPMDIIHHLKLDRTYTGLQTLGSETLVDIWIYADPRNSKRNIDGTAVQSVVSRSNEPEAEMHADDSASRIKGRINELSSSELFANNNGENKLTDSASEIFDMIIDEKPAEEIEDGTMSNKRLRFYVNLDHDYCGSMNSLDGNSTVDHLSVASRSNEVSKRKLEQKNSIKIKDETSLVAPLFLNQFEENRTKALPSSCSKLQLNLCPLEISIPPLFESSNKHVLVLQNNRTIPVDIAIPRHEDHSHKPSNEKKMTLTATRGISLLKKPSSFGLDGAETRQGLKLQFSKSILLNVNSNVPALKIAERKTVQEDRVPSAQKESAAEECTPRTENDRIKVEESKELQSVSESQPQPRQRITLGKDKYKLQSKKEFCYKVFRAIDAANISNIQGLLKFIVRRMPMITQDASDSDYKQFHPYACVTDKEFFEYSIAKRTACEWSRAKIIRSMLKNKSLPEKELWTVKEILIWTRLHGYTPFRSGLFARDAKRPKNLSDSATVATKTTFTCSEPDAFCKWLQIYPSRSPNHWFDANLQQFNEHDVEVDIMNDNKTTVEIREEVETSVAKQANSNNLSNTKVAVLEMEAKSTSFYDFVCETAREIGVKLNPEEILPQVVYCAAGRMIMRAIECLVDDLIRMSLAKAWERCDNGYPKVIVLDDVRGALLNREEFDIFTNQGLGSKYQRTSTD
nr:uncharacterized protein LOC116432746 isoform X1 [Nomia melanderi]